MYDNFVLQRRKRFFHEQEDELVKDITPETTAGAKHYMSAAYENADWAVRAPKVIKRTAVSGDNFWKGVYDHENAEYQFYASWFILFTVSHLSLG